MKIELAIYYGILSLLIELRRITITTGTFEEIFPRQSRHVDCCSSSSSKTSGTLFDESFSFQFAHPSTEKELRNSFATLVVATRNQLGSRNKPANITFLPHHPTAEVHYQNFIVFVLRSGSTLLLMADHHIKTINFNSSQCCYCSPQSHFSIFFFFAVVLVVNKSEEGKEH